MLDNKHNLINNGDNDNIIIDVKIIREYDIKGYDDLNIQHIFNERDINYSLTIIIFLILNHKIPYLLMETIEQEDKTFF